MRVVQAYFFGWGFYVLGQDDALERKLTGQPPKPQGNPETLAGVGNKPSSRRDSPNASPPPLNIEIDGNDKGKPGQERAAIAVDGAVAIEIEPSDERNSSEEKSTSDDDTGDGRGGGEEDRWAVVKQRIRRVLVSPNIISVTIGVVISMIGPLQEMLFDNPRAVIRPLGAALQVSSSVSVATGGLLVQKSRYLTAHNPVVDNYSSSCGPTF